MYFLLAKSARSVQVSLLRIDHNVGKFSHLFFWNQSHSFLISFLLLASLTELNAPTPSVRSIDKSSSFILKCKKWNVMECNFPSTRNRRDNCYVDIFWDRSYSYIHIFTLKFPLKFLNNTLSLILERVSKDSNIKNPFWSPKFISFYYQIFLSHFRSLLCYIGILWWLLSSCKPTDSSH